MKRIQRELRKQIEDQLIKKLELQLAQETEYEIWFKVRGRLLDELGDRFYDQIEQEQLK